MKLVGSPFQHSLEGRGCFARWMLETIGSEAKGRVDDLAAISLR